MHRLRHYIQWFGCCFFSFVFWIFLLVVMLHWRCFLHTHPWKPTVYWWCARGMKMLFTHTPREAPAHACAPVGPRTRWPEGCSCPISVCQLSEDDSNPSEGRAHTFSPLCILSSLSPQNVHKAPDKACPPPKQCHRLAATDSSEKSHILVRAQAAARVWTAPGSTAVQPPANIHHLHHPCALGGCWSLAGLVAEWQWMWNTGISYRSLRGKKKETDVNPKLHPLNAFSP